MWIHVQGKTKQIRKSKRNTREKPSAFEGVEEGTIASL